MSNPYPGPRPFRPEEYRIFAGRDHEIGELSSLIVSHRVTLLYAQSGAGKTSLVNAGLSQALGEKHVQLLPLARVGIPVPKEIPLNEVANVYTYSAIGDLLPETPDADPWLLKATLAEAFEKLPPNVDESGEPAVRVLTFDQFEELFSAYPQRWHNRENFFQQVAEMLDARRELRVLFVMREDFLAAFGEFAELLPEGGSTRYRLERLREPEALQAITKPLEGTSRSYDDDVPETMVRDLMAITVVDPSGQAVSVPGEFVEPVQLQVVCFTLFERIPDSTNLLTLDLYRQYGDPDQALEDFYRAAIEAASADSDVDEGVLRDWFENQLITPSGTRGLVFQGRDLTGGMPNRVIEVLEGRHLIRPEIRSGSRWYELTHDRFIRPVQRSNLAWKSKRWQSFEAQYSQAIREAVRQTGIPEKELRDFLDSLVSPSGERLSHAADGVPDDALAVLVEKGLLSRESLEGRQLYTPLHDTIATAIRQSNQNWRAANWSEAKALSKLESQAKLWARADSKRASLLLSQSDLPEADNLIHAAQVSGIAFSEILDAFVKASREAAAWRLKKKWLKGAALVLAAVGGCSFLLGDRPQLSTHLLYFAVSGIAAVASIGLSEKDDEVAALGLTGLLLWVAVGALIGAWFPLHMSRYIGAPLSFVVGFVGTAFFRAFVPAFRRSFDAARNRPRNAGQN
jgi:hypothetical protein